MGVLSQSLQDIVDQLKPSPEEQTRQADALQQVCTYMNRTSITPNVPCSSGSFATCDRQHSPCMSFTDQLHKSGGAPEGSLPTSEHAYWPSLLANCQQQKKLLCKPVSAVHTVHGVDGHYGFRQHHKSCHALISGTG